MRLSAVGRSHGPISGICGGTSPETERNTDHERQGRRQHLCRQRGYHALQLHERTAGSNLRVFAARHHDHLDVLLLFPPAHVLPDRSLLRIDRGQDNPAAVRHADSAVARLRPVGAADGSRTAFLLRNEKQRHQRRCQGALSLAGEKPPRNHGKGAAEIRGFLSGNHAVVPEPAEKSGHEALKKSRF